MTKAELKASGAKVSASTNDVPAIFNRMYEFGKLAGQGKRAKLDAAQALQAAVAAKELDVSTKELRDAAVAKAAQFYEDGVVQGGGDKFADLSMTVFKSELGKFVELGLSKHGAAVQKMVEAVPAKSRVRLDTYQTAVAVGRLIADARG